MEHIIQFGITIDDDAIKKNVEAQTLDALTDKLVKKIEEHMPQKFYGGVDWKTASYELIEQFLENNKDEIMNLAADRLVEKVARTKAWREKYGKAIE